MSAYRCMPHLREAWTSISPRKGGQRPERGDDMWAEIAEFLHTRRVIMVKNPLYMHIHAVECVQMRCECV